MASTRLSKTLGTPTDNKKWTWSAWVKRGTGFNVVQRMFYAINGSSYTTLQFDDESNLIWFNEISGVGTDMQLKTTQLFRDPSAWYHIVIAYDSANSTVANRQIIYINGVRVTSFATENTAGTNANTAINQAVPHTVGSSNGGGNYFNGLMTHVYFIDGTAYTPTSFGEVDSTSGIWKAKSSASVTYGNNGFFLKFANSGAMGTDSSGKSNNFTVNGTLTQNIDSPDNNFCVLNFLDTTRGLSNGNTTYAGASSGTVVKGTLGMLSGKYYAECKILSAAQNMIGVLSIAQAPSTTYVGATAVGWGLFGDGTLYNNASATSNFSNSFSDNDIMGIALDMDNNKLYFSKNGVFQNSGDPTSGSTGTGAVSITSGLTMTFCGGRDSSSDTANFNFGNGKFGTTAVSSAGTNASGNGIFEYDVPTGYTALSTKGLNS